MKEDPNPEDKYLCWCPAVEGRKGWGPCCRVDGGNWVCREGKIITSRTFTWEEQMDIEKVAKAYPHLTFIEVVTKLFGEIWESQGSI
jgi:hypothetical protein